MIMTKIMQTLWDESSDLSDDILSNSSVVSDTYTSGTVKDIRETIENGNQIADDLNEKDEVV